VPGETIELPTNGLQNRYSMIDRGYVQGQIGRGSGVEMVRYDGRPRTTAQV
jgi:hypothetical protein